MRQKLCVYCNTPAEPMATKCISCGSPLPVALPRPVAKLVEAQGRWRFRTTLLVTLGASLLIGTLYGYFGTGGTFGWQAFIVLSWVIGIMPTMLVYSGWMNARRNIARLLFYVVASGGMWLVNLIAVFSVATTLAAQNPPLAVEGIDAGGNNNQAADNGVAVGDVSENQ